jgi:hypothetical protein
VRRYATGVQLVLLVCAGVASGYLWRAALHPRTTVASELAPQIQYPTWPFTKPPTNAGRRQVQPRTKRSTQQHTEARRGLSAARRHTVNSGAELASVATPSHAVNKTKPAPSASKAPKPPTAPHPKSPPAPTPPATVEPPATPPTPSSPPPASSPPPPSSPPVVSVVAQQQAAQPSARPGWGHGDPNHDHTGPPGHSGKGESKK